MGLVDGGFPWPPALGEALHPGGDATSRRLLELCAPAPGGWVLDAGCGRGTTLDLLRRGGWHAVGVDRAPDRLQHAARRGTVVEGTLEALPFPGGCFDGVVCECVLSQTGDPGKVLAEFFRVLREGGVLGLADLFLPENQCSGAREALGCVGGARSVPEVERDLAEAGFVFRVREDHSGAVRAMAAQLAWAGLLPEMGCGDLRRGYALWVAQKISPSDRSGAERSG